MYRFEVLIAGSGNAGLTTVDISVEPYSEADFYADLKTTTLFRRDNIRALTEVAESVHSRLGGKRSDLDTLAKSNWAQPLDSPPFPA
jgi:hypothetical protein